MRSSTISVYACWSVCALTFFSHIYQKSLFQISPHFSMHVIYGRGSVYLRQQCNMLWTSGLSMTSCFHTVDWIGLNQRRVGFVWFVRWRHQSDVRRRFMVEFAMWRHQGKVCLHVISCYRSFTDDFAARDCQDMIRTSCDHYRRHHRLLTGNLANISWKTTHIQTQIVLSCPLTPKYKLV